jgi:hypothetical protein
VTSSARRDDEQRRARVQRHVVGPDPAGEHGVEQLKRLLPQRRVPFLPRPGVEPLVPGPRVVDQQVQAAVVGGDARGDARHGLVVTMVADHADAVGTQAAPFGKSKKSAEPRTVGSRALK